MLPYILLLWMLSLPVPGPVAALGFAANTTNFQLIAVPRKKKLEKIIYVRPCTAMCTAMYGHVYSHVRPCTAMCTAMYGHVRPCTAMCTAMYGHVYGHVRPCKILLTFVILVMEIIFGLRLCCSFEF
jgi:hypothetical protein